MRTTSSTCRLRSIRPTDPSCASRAGSTSVADAVGLYESKRTQSRAGSLVPAARRVTFTDLLALLETDHAEKLNRVPWPKKLERLTRLVEHFDGWKAQAIDAAAISVYTAARLKVAKRGT